MSLFARILLGAVITIWCAFMVYRTDLMLVWFGRSWWAETKLGGGGSRVLYKAIGILGCFIGIIIMTDLFDVIIGQFVINLFS